MKRSRFSEEQIIGKPVQLFRQTYQTPTNLSNTNRLFTKGHVPPNRLRLTYAKVLLSRSSTDFTLEHLGAGANVRKK